MKRRAGRSCMRRGKVPCVRTPSRMSARRNGPIIENAKSPAPRKKSTGNRIRKQGAIEDVDPVRAQKNVAPARGCIGFQRLRGADVVPERARVFQNFGEGGAVPQTEVQALRGERRKDVRGFADERDAMAGKTIGAHPRHGEKAARPIDLDLAQKRVDLIFDLLRQLRLGKRAAALRRLGGHQPDEARTIWLVFDRAQRHQRAGARSRVELRRNIPVRLCVRKESRERDLWIGPGARADPRLGSCGRHAAVGGGGEFCRDALPIGESGTDRILAKTYVVDHAFVQNEVWGPGRDFGKALDEHIVLDILAESGKADLARGEGNGGHRKPRSGGVDHGDFGERRGLAAKMRPYAKRLIKAQRGLEKRDGPPVGACIDMANADNGKSRLRESNRGGKAGGAGAGNENVGLRFGS